MEYYKYNKYKLKYLSLKNKYKGYGFIDKIALNSYYYVKLDKYEDFIKYFINQIFYKNTLDLYNEILKKYNEDKDINKKPLSIIINKKHLGINKNIFYVVEGFLNSPLDNIAYLYKKYNERNDKNIKTIYIYTYIEDIKFYEKTDKYFIFSVNE